MPTNKGGQETVTSTDPWKPSQDYIKTGFRGAEQILNRPTVAPFSPEQEMAMQATTGRAMMGNPLVGQAQSAMGDILQGGGPMMDAVMANVRPGIDSAFERGGRYGSAIHSQMLGKGVAQGFAPYMMQAAQMSPALANQDYFDAAQMGGVGAQRQGLYQQQLDDPYNRLARYMGLVSGNFGGTSEGESENKFDPFSTAIGAGMLGFGLFG